MQHFTLTICFLEDNSVFSLNTRTLHFTVRGGKAIEFDRDNPLTEAKEKPVFLTTKDILREFRNFDLITIYKARVLSVIAAFKAVIRLFQSIGK